MTSGSKALWPDDPFGSTTAAAWPSTEPTKLDSDERDRNGPSTTVTLPGDRPVSCQRWR